MYFLVIVVINEIVIVYLLIFIVKMNEDIWLIRVKVFFVSFKLCKFVFF